MYLKSIEIQGFKSFANKIVFDFHNGITGIVGPNGSGKSNVADAVRWVLGEQKVKQLRSSSMQDVIFAGTENRKPLSFAYVAITLDNADHSLPLDYNEVTVARRVYRSGESEYLLNGTACRLKDINELFYDTGIGKEGYSIIGQGQIDRILSGKPEERRELFDEAAGIVKFKRRKAMTMKKLENEQQNLVRITDIITELEQRVGPLERQSEKAREYLKKKEELKSCDVSLFVSEMERIEQDTLAVTEKIEIADNQMKEASGKYESTREQYDELQQKITENDEAIASLQEKIRTTGVDKEKLEGQINVLKEQIHAIEQSESHVKDRLEALGTEIDRHQQTGQRYSDEKEEIDQQIQEERKRREALTEKMEALREQASAYEARIDSGKEEVLKLLDARAVIEGEQQRYSAMMEQADIRRAQLNRQILMQKSTKNDTEGQLKSAEESLEILDGEILDLEKKKVDITAKRRKWREESDGLNKKLDEVMQQFHRDSSRLESLRNIAERYDGYGNSIRRVMDRKSDTPGILGVVADLIKVEKKYEIAVETALGGSIQNIVTDNEHTAKKMISYLKQNRYGRATFLPLTSVSAPENVPARKALKEPGAIGLADTLVQTDEKYVNIAGYLLGRILVADTIDHAVAIQKKFRYSLRIVTLEGESLQPGGSMTGGAFRNNSNLLGRNREIETLEKGIETLRRNEHTIRERLEEIYTADELLGEDLDELSNSLQEARLKQNTLRVEVEHLREERDSSAAFYKNIRREMEGLDRQKQQIESDKEQTLIREADSQKREKEIAQETQSLTELLAQKNEEIAAVSEELAQSTVAAAQLEQKADFARENIQRVAEEILSLHQTQQEVLLNASNSGQEIEARRQQISQMKEASLEAEQENEKLSAELKSRRTQKEEMASFHKQFLDQREALSSELSQLDKELFRLNDRREKLEHAEENLTNYMWEEYELTRHAAMEQKKEDGTGAAELKKRIAVIKDEIRKLGNVNVNAIEEYKEVSERYTFLHGQYEDIKKAESTLRDIIADLDDGMKKQFAEKFAEIQNEFDKAFKDLFGGGKGTLELTMDEEKDILECGVRIIAQPPGKKLQNMMQLSGGEKALTAIALLFAIQNLKPSPFCLLDEIEAALDDSNVDRYAHYLHKLTKNTQFIIITHRRGTMTAADRLYGITMQEKGVSAMVSVNLIEKDLDE